jgi:hypothetical protein
VQSADPADPNPTVTPASEPVGLHGVLTELTQAVVRVLQLHAPLVPAVHSHPVRPRPTCQHCALAWPCPTVHAILDALADALPALALDTGRLFPRTRA